MKRRLLGAVLLLVGGALHARLAFDGYGTSEVVEMFFFNGVASGAIAGGIALGSGWLAPAAGMGVGSMSLVAFALSRFGDGVLGFRGRGLAPAPEAVLVVVSEVLAVAVLGWILLERRTEIVATLRSASVRRRHG